MLNRLKGMKDSAIALFIRSFANERLAKFGEVLEAQVDTKQACIRLKVLLKGESGPIEVSIDRYDLERVGDDRFIRIKSLSCSREWIGVALNHRLADKPFKVPAAVSSLL